jgi:hypothetical protein
LSFARPLNPTDFAGPLIHLLGRVWATGPNALGNVHVDSAVSKTRLLSPNAG